MVMVAMPRWLGQPNSCCRVTNSNSADRPSITSGITSGVVVSTDSVVRPRKRPSRVRPRAAAVPITTASVADRKATIRLFFSADSSASFCSSAPYQRVEKPPQTVTSFEALKEYRISDRIGRYRKA